MPSIFTKIINGEVPCYKIAEDEQFFAFMDITPVAKGHVLVIPKREVDYIFNLDDDTYLGLMAFSKKIAKAIEKAVPCKKVGVTVIGLEVLHAHVHLVPINSMDDINFSKPKLKLSEEEMEQISERIRAEL